MDNKAGLIGEFSSIYLTSLLKCTRFREYVKHQSAKSFYVTTIETGWAFNSNLFFLQQEILLIIHKLDAGKFFTIAHSTICFNMILKYSFLHVVFPLTVMISYLLQISTL